MRRYLVIALLLASGCTVQPFKKPLENSLRASPVQPAVYVRPDNRGVGINYFTTDSSAVGAQYGAIGSLVSGIMDAIANRMPLAVAQFGADTLADTFKLEQIEGQLREQLTSQLSSDSLFKDPAQFISIPPKQVIEAAAFKDERVLAVELDYALSQDLRYLRVAATASMFDKATIPPPPTDPKVKAKKIADSGLVYRNRFEYFSTRLAPAPEKSQAEIDAEVEKIRAKYGKVRQNDPRRREMMKEIREAKQPTPPLVKADYLVRQWLSGPQQSKLDMELKTGVATVVGLLVRDISDPSLPDPKSKESKTVLERGEERNVVRYNVGLFDGSLASEPINFQPAPSTGTWYSEKLGKIALPR